MISFDTNILLYALNADCPEHAAARRFFDECATRDDVVVAELVLVELYVLLRNPAVVRSPLAAAAAVSACQAFRRNPRWALVENAPVMEEVWRLAARPRVARRRIFDARLALTLRYHGVGELATDNVRHFDDFGFDRVFSPVRGEREQ
jgi:toxin-antitoxin system PIN domain toxin